MKLHRFFIKDIDLDSDEILLEEKDAIHQIKNVLRLSIDDPVMFLDGLGNEAIFSLKKVMKKSLIFSKEVMKKFSRKNDFFMKIYPAIIKKDKLEYVLQKCTEIGVLEFCPLVSDRTEKLNFNMKRAEVIIKEAAEQSEKSYLPRLSSPVNFSELVSKCETGKVVVDVAHAYYLDMDSPIIDVKQVRETYLNERNNVDNQSAKRETAISFFVGPEGGWSEKDREMFNKLGIKSVSLGDTVLRAETASIAVSSLMLLGI